MYYILLPILQGVRFPLISYHSREIETRVIIYVQTTLNLGHQIRLTHACLLIYFKKNLLY